MSGTLRLRGSTSGYSELQAPAVAADQTFVLPTAGGTLLTTDSPVPKLTLELGSASQPSLTFQGDTDTGLFSEGTNTLNLVTGGSSKVVLGAAAHTIYAGTGATVRAIDIDSLGRVGVGTTSPLTGANLTVAGTGLAITGQNTAHSANSIRIGEEGSGAAQIRCYGPDATTNGSLNFRVSRSDGSNSKDVIIDSSGNVGIGTTSFPANGTNLKISDGTIARHILEKTGSNARIFEIGNGGTFLNIYDATADSERMRIDSAGNVGIGTATPDALLDVENSSGAAEVQIKSLNASDCTLAFGDNADTDVGRIRYAHSADAMLFFTAANERLRIDSSGNVGIGTSSPTDKLSIHTAPNSLVIGAKDTTRGNHVFQLLANNVAGDGEFRLYKNAASGTHGKTVEIKSTGISYFNGGNVVLQATNSSGSGFFGVRNSAYGALGVGDTYIYNNGNDITVMAEGSSNVIKFASGGNTERLRVDSDGRLLVGTSTSAGVGATLQAIGDTAAQFHRGENSTSGASITISKSRNTVYGSNTIVQNGDLIGTIVFRADDGTDYNSTAALVGCEVDGTPGANDMPGRLVFKTTEDGASSPTERMKISSRGEVKISHSNTTANLLFIHNTDTNAGTRLSVIKGGTTNTSDTTTKLISFERNDGTEIGKIRRGGFSSVAYDTSSDYRIKSNVVSLTGAIDRVKEFNPIRFNWLEDTSDTPIVVDGFLAHEAQTVVPEAVSGYKNEVDEEGNLVIQGIDQSKLVPLLTAALQEAIAKIETLEQRLSDAGIA
jgi:hypothetical protein